MCGEGRPATRTEVTAVRKKAAKAGGMPGGRGTFIKSMKLYVIVLSAWQANCRQLMTNADLPA
jgi:hypothetical protein